MREDELASDWIKSLRHELGSLVAKIDRRHRLGARSAEDDAGTGISNQSEQSRGDVRDLVPAAAERVTQAMRCLEEYGKIACSDLGQAFKSLRYQAYDVLAKTELRLMKNKNINNCHLYLLIDCSLPKEDFSSYVEQLAKSGVDAFQIRDKQADGAQLVAYTELALAACRNHESLVFVNDRLDVAIAAQADGVHLGQDDIRIADARRLIQSSASDLIIGVSTHNLEQVAEAEQGGADYIGCGPTFQSTTKSFDSFAGPEFVAQACERTKLPAFAIGGINEENLEQIVACNCRRIAVSGVIHESADACDTAKRLKAMLIND